MFVNIEDMCYMSAYTSSEICTSLNAVTGLGLDKKSYQPKELNQKNFKVVFPYNILLNIKSGITPAKSRDSATLFLFNCRRWDYSILAI